MAANYILKLGTAGFLIDDMPEELPFNGEQTIAVRRFPGGRIHIQNFGAFENEVTLKGDFFGGDAFGRAKSGAKLKLDKHGYVVLNDGTKGIAKIGDKVDMDPDSPKYREIVSGNSNVLTKCIPTAQLKYLKLKVKRLRSRDEPHRVGNL